MANMGKKLRIRILVLLHQLFYNYGIRKLVANPSGPVLVTRNPHGRGYPLNYSIEPPPVRTTNQFVAAEYSGCCLECCLHRTKCTVVVNTETRTRLLSGVLSECRLANMQRKKRSRTENRHANTDDRHVFPKCLTRGAAKL